MSDFLDNFRYLKFKAALESLDSNLPEGWKWELTVWKDGERWKVNPAGAYQESAPSITVELTEIKDVEGTRDA